MVYNGKEYERVEVGRENGCEGCAFESDDGDCRRSRIPYDYSTYCYDPWWTTPPAQFIFKEVESIK